MTHSDGAKADQVADVGSLSSRIRFAREDCPQVIDEHTHPERSAQLDAMEEEYPRGRGAPRRKQAVKRATLDLVAHQPTGKHRDARS